MFFCYFDDAITQLHSIISNYNRVHSSKNAFYNLKKSLIINYPVIKNIC